MIKKLTKHGNSHCLVIEKAIIELLKWDVNGQLEIKTDGRKLIIQQVKRRSTKDRPT